MHIQLILKKSCMVAAAKARLNSAGREIEPKLTIVQVTVVPTFAPIIMGIALVTVMQPDATIPTIIEVVVEELWIILVTSIPIKSPIKGFEVLLIRAAAKFLPSDLKPAPSKPIAKRKK